MIGMTLVEEGGSPRAVNLDEQFPMSDLKRTKLAATRQLNCVQFKFLEAPAKN